MGLQDTEQDRERNSAIREGFDAVCEVIRDAAETVAEAIREAAILDTETPRGRARGDGDGT